MNEVTSLKDRRFKRELAVLVNQISSGEVADPMKSLMEIASRQGINEHAAISLLNEALEKSK